MSYFVIDPSGAQYGPADVPTLQQWAREGRIQATTTVRDAQTGQTMMASAIPGLFPGGPGPAYAPPPYGGTPPVGNPYSQPITAYPRGYYGGDDGSKDVQTAWIYAVLSLFCCAIIFGLLGIQTANRAISKGNEGGRAPLIVSYIGLALWGVGLILRFAVLSR